MYTVLLLFAFILDTTSAKRFEDANKDFSTSFYEKYSKRDTGNFLISPFSAQNILALTESGSRGATAEQLRSVLALEDTNFGRVLDSLNDSPSYALLTANKIYVQNEYPISTNFLINAATSYKSEGDNINFKRKNRAARIINRWVEEKTQNRIQNLIESSELNDDVKIILVNALYFKANWSRPFPASFTKKMDFHLSNYETVQTDMMVLHNKMFKYHVSTEFDAQFLEIPFKGEDASMVVVLPNQIEGLPNLESSLGKILKSRSFTDHYISLILPKFKIETSTDMKPILKEMGVTKIFNQNQADLSGIAGKKGDLVVDKVAQKTFIEVSEEGVEAAAATYAVGVLLLSGPTEVPKIIRVDRPFIFYIQVKGVVIFVGRVTDPRPENTHENIIEERIIFRN